MTGFLNHLQTDKSPRNYWVSLSYQWKLQSSRALLCARALCSLLQYLVPFPKPCKLRMENCTQSWCSSFSVFMSRTGSCQSSERLACSLPLENEDVPVSSPRVGREIAKVSTRGLAFLKPRAHLCPLGTGQPHSAAGGQGTGMFSALTLSSGKFAVMANAQMSQLPHPLHQFSKLFSH